MHFYIRGLNIDKKKTPTWAISYINLICLVFWKTIEDRGCQPIQSYIAIHLLATLDLKYPFRILYYVLTSIKLDNQRRQKHTIENTL